MAARARVEDIADDETLLLETFKALIHISELFITICDEQGESVMKYEFCVFVWWREEFFGFFIFVINRYTRLSDCTDRGSNIRGIQLYQ